MQFRDINTEAEFIVADNLDRSGDCPVFIQVEDIAVGVTKQQAERIVEEIQTILAKY